jgi:tetratricopeptide (TPR) repeat protein
VLQQRAEYYRIEAAKRGWASDFKQADDYCRKELADLNRAISIGEEINWDVKVTYEWRCNCYLNLEMFSQALRDADRIVQFNPQWYESYITRSSCYRGLGKYEQALRDANKAIELAHNAHTEGKAYYERGLVYKAMGNLTSAQSDFARAGVNES